MLSLGRKIGSVGSGILVEILILYFGTVVSQILVHMVTTALVVVGTQLIRNRETTMSSPRPDYSGTRPAPGRRMSLVASVI